MSGDDMANVIFKHRWAHGGGTAVGAWWRCACGVEGWARSGLRSDADRLGAAHVAALLGDPAPEPVTADEVAEVMDQAVNVGPLLVDGRLVTTAQRIATVLLDRFHVTRRADA